MHAEDRPIHFAAELIHFPCAHEVPTLQRLYFELSQMGHSSYDSTDFGTPGQYRFHSKRGEKAQSIALFLRDRMVLIEEWVDMPLVSFLKKLEEVALRAMDLLRIPCFIAYTSTIRTTFALTHFSDARVFLLDHVCRQEGRLLPHLRRPIAGGGLRFVLPETPQHPGSLTVTVESFRHSVNEVYVEVRGVFGRQRVERDSFPIVCDHIRQLRQFICDDLYGFMNQYDTPQQKGV